MKNDEPPAARRHADLALPYFCPERAAVVAVAPVLGVEVEEDGVLACV